MKKRVWIFALAAVLCVWLAVANKVADICQ